MVETPSLEVFKRHVDTMLGKGHGGELGSAELTVDDLKGLLAPKNFCDSMILRKKIFHQI